MSRSLQRACVDVVIYCPSASMVVRMQPRVLAFFVYTQAR